jgi:hypothetical protein
MPGDRSWSIGRERIGLDSTPQRADVDPLADRWQGGQRRASSSEESLCSAGVASSAVMEGRGEEDEPVQQRAAFARGDAPLVLPRFVGLEVGASVEQLRSRKKAVHDAADDQTPERQKGESTRENASGGFTII